MVPLDIIHEDRVLLRGEIVNRINTEIMANEIVTHCRVSERGLFYLL